ncbi:MULTISPECIES: hypothetical protein [Streptomyces]|uniref:Uncharacterized protein n=2 Tax=Streptomyces TaxID=1883 RepID=A0ABV9J448_9ACTN
MTRTWTLELAKIDVTVNALVPTALTRMGAGMPRSADDVATVIVYLASKESAGMTGQAIAAGDDRIARWTRPGEVADQLRPSGWTTSSVSELFAGAYADRPQDFRPAPFGLEAIGSI